MLARPAPQLLQGIGPAASPSQTLLIFKLSFRVFIVLLGIDIGRGNERDGCGLNEGIFRYKYAVGGGTKPSYGND